ncbi:DUF761 domain protein [Senna tora]|uniref:DUF761 domain protein n=1 Tax=Senna tora TaxID=362788 RepID=A0A834TCC4_9FABA|nr:DUF761 domain protein [Senna tora]
MSGVMEVGVDVGLRGGGGGDNKYNNKQIARKGTEDIYVSAEAFIKNFRQQLLIQRLQSIENYEQMLARNLNK